MKCAARLLVTGIAATSLNSLIVAQGVAQTGTSQDAANVNLEEITVTAQKRIESAQSVPISIAAVSGDNLEKAGAINLENVQRLTPGLTISTIGTGWVSYTYIRGVGTSQVDPGADPSVAYFVDEVYVGGASGLQFELADIERIEVLKGPQGTLFGRNTSGGAVNVITRRPQAQTAVSFTGDIGNYDLKAGRGSITGALSTDGKWRYRLAASGRHRDPVTDNPLGRDPGKADTYGSRGQLEYAGASVDALLSAEYFNADYGMANVFLLTPCTNAPVNTCATNAAGAAAIAARPDQGFFRGYYDHPNGFEKQEVWSVTGRVEWQLPFSTLTSITAYRDNQFHRVNDQDGSIADSYMWNTDEGDRTFSQELRLANQKDRFNWIAGLYYYHADIDRHDVLPFGPHWLAPPLVNTTYSDTNQLAIESYAAFGQATYDFSEKFSLTLGGRYTHDQKQSDKSVSYAVAAGGGYIVHPRETWKSFDPAVTFGYQANPDLLLYSSYRRGFKSGGFQTVLQASAAIAGRPYDPEHVDSFEAGVKSQWLDRRLRVNVAGFHTRIADQQVSRVVPGISPAPFIDNAGSASSDGVDLDVSIQLTANLRIDSASTYQKARFDSYDTLVGGVPVSYAGNHQLRSPDFTTSFVGTYAIPLGSWGNVTLRGEYFRQSTVYFNSENFGLNPSGNDLAQRPYDLVNARLGLEPAGRSWELSLWGKNLGDTQYCRNIANVGLSGLCAPGDPRTYGVTFGVHFE